MKFDKIVKQFIFETLDTKIPFNPIKLGQTYSQTFKKYEKLYIIKSNMFDLNDVKNILHIEFKNIDKNTYDLTYDIGYPGAIYGIVFNWTIDLIKSNKYENIQHIVIGTHFDITNKSHQQRKDVYDKIIKKFIKLNPKYEENKNLVEKLYSRIKNPIDRNNVVIFAISLKEPI